MGKQTKFKLKPFGFYNADGYYEISYECRHAENCVHYYAYMYFLEFLRAFDLGMNSRDATWLEGHRV